MNCVITGGGIGAATAKRFIAEGAQVLILDINMQAADALTNDLGPSATTFRCDVKSETEVKAAADAAYGRWGRVDVLVNNAGSELNRSYDETIEDEWDRVLNTDLKGPWRMCKHFVPPMVKAGSGSCCDCKKRS
jgi:NAD(P)-dependent dehydrogenase (short-subunit alcohol dehydrogenase family)